MKFPRATYSVVHCRSYAAAAVLNEDLAQRLAEWGLELHPAKTRIVYCPDDNRHDSYVKTSFNFSAIRFVPDAPRIVGASTSLASSPR